MIRSPYSFLNATPRDLRRPLFPVPEDIFASDDHVAKRNEQEIRSPAIDRAIDDWNTAKEEGDESGLRAAAKSIVDATSAAFKMQGAPAFAHPVLPPQFVKAQAAEIARLTKHDQTATISALLEKFDFSTRPLATQQLAGQLARVQSGPTPSQLPMPRHKPQRPIPYNEKDPMQPHAPTWIPEEHERTWLEWFQSWTESPEPKLPVEVTPRSKVDWDEELRQRTEAGARNRQRQERFDDFRAQSGTPISPDERLRRDLAVRLRQQGKEPLYFSPKAAHRDDPYKDRVAWPSQPQFQEPADDVVVVSPWGLRDIKKKNDSFHPGVDFRNRPGRPAFSPKNGTVLAISQSPRGGNEVFILLDDGSIVSFAHTRALDDGRGRKLDVGDEVYAGQLIGWSDGSGVNADGTPVDPHTHISYYPPGTPVDPDTKKPLQGPNSHSPSTTARTQSDPFDGLGYRHNPRPLNPEGYTGKQPMRVDRGRRLVR